jgi:hypothetical protein
MFSRIAGTKSETYSQVLGFINQSACMQACVKYSLRATAGIGMQLSCVWPIDVWRCGEGAVRTATITFDRSR